MVHRVRVQRYWHPQVRKITHTLRSPIVVHDVTVEHQQDHVELQKYLGRGLVYCRHHSPACVRQSVQETDQVESSSRVESGCRLIEEDQRGVDQQLHTD